MFLKLSQHKTDTRLNILMINRYPVATCKNQCIATQGNPIWGQKLMLCVHKRIMCIHKHKKWGTLCSMWLYYYYRPMFWCLKLRFNKTQANQDYCYSVVSTDSHFATYVHLLPIYKISSRFSPIQKEQPATKVQDCRR